MWKYLLLIVITQRIGAQLMFYSRCNCEDFQSEIECNNVVNCAWRNNSCGLKLCVNINLKRCETLFRCSINQKKICEDTMDCPDYTADVQIDCMFKRGNCAAESDKINGKYKCKNYQPVVCSQQTADYCKNTFESENTYCWLNELGKCQGYDPMTCTNTPLEICSNLGCDDTGYECQQFSCQQHLTPGSCNWVEDGYFGNKTLCSWNYEYKVCEERTNLDDLVENNCSLFTDGGYHWVNDQCVQCMATEEDELETEIFSQMMMICLFLHSIYF